MAKPSSAQTLHPQALLRALQATRGELQRWRAVAKTNKYRYEHLRDRYEALQIEVQKLNAAAVTPLGKPARPKIFSSDYPAAAYQAALAAVEANLRKPWAAAQMNLDPLLGNPRG